LEFGVVVAVEYVYKLPVGLVIQREALHLTGKPNLERVMNKTKTDHLLATLHPYDTVKRAFRFEFLLFFKFNDVVTMYTSLLASR
jgi:hypothetical protein